MEESTTQKDKTNCKNCTLPIIESAKYCSHCGQKNTDGRISISSFFSVFFSTVFNLESKFFQTIGHIFIPGKLTVEFFKGKHKRYFHPVRFFIVTALFLIAAISYSLTDGAINSGIRDNTENQVRKAKFLAEMDSISQQTLDKFPNSASIKPAFDTLYHTLSQQSGSKTDSINTGRSFGPVMSELDFKISNEDFINLSPEELVEKYKVENYFSRFIFKQKIKLIKDKGNFAPFLLGNSLWIILLMMPFLALILKGLYIRHDYYYVEHLVFSFHTHAFAFLLFAIIGFLIHLNAPSWLIAVGFFILLLYLYKALREVYGQERYKTIAKLLFANVVYIFLFGGFFILGLLTSMAIF